MERQLLFEEEPGEYAESELYSSIIRARGTFAERKLNILEERLSLFAANKGDKAIVFRLVIRVKAIALKIDDFLTEHTRERPCVK